MAAAKGREILAGNVKTPLFKRVSWAIAGLSVLFSGCAPTVVEPARGTGAVISVKPLPVAGLADATAWKNGDLTPTPNLDACPHQKEEFEKALQLTDAEACPIVREVKAVGGKQGSGATALVPASGDGDAELAKPIAPHCYAVGSVIIVVRYEEPQTHCSRIVGIAVLPKK